MPGVDELEVAQAPPALREGLAAGRLMVGARRELKRFQKRAWFQLGFNLVQTA